MPEPMKLRKKAEATGTSERALVIGAIETTPSLRKAAEKLGVTEGAIRAAMKRLNINIAHKTVVIP